jgi:hypothetical protein
VPAVDELVLDFDTCTPLTCVVELLVEPLDEPPDDGGFVVVVSLANTMSCAAWMPSGDGSLTVSTQCVNPALFCAAVGGQNAFAFEPILPALTVNANGPVPPLAFEL